MSEKRGDEIELTAAEEAALDRAWAGLDREAAPGPKTPTAGRQAPQAPAPKAAPAKRRRYLR